jgi:hypothetical protein
MVRRHRGRADDDLGSIRLENIALVLADLVRADENASVALTLRDQRQAYSGVAAGRFDDGAAGLDPAVTFGLLDHAQSDPVFD